MSFQDDLLGDECIIFDESGISVPIRFTTVKGNVFDNRLANIEKNNTGLFMNDGLESNKSESLISIPINMFKEIGINDSNVNGCRILEKKTKKEWTVTAIAKESQLTAKLACEINPFTRAKA